VLSAWFVNRFNFDHQILISTIALLSLGLFHGVFDLDIAGLTTSKKWKILLIYLLSIGGMSLVLIADKAVAIILLLLVSSFHFGEDFILKTPHKILISTLVGVNILAWFFLLNIEDLNLYLNQINLSVSLNKVPILISNGILSVLIYLFDKTNKPWFLLNSILVILLSLSTGLIPAFAIYFCLGHSLPSSLTQIQFFEKKLNKKAFRKTLLSGFTIFGIAIALMLIFWYYKPIQIQGDLVLNTLIYLMILSVPHSVVMHNMQKSNE
jgi:Brp/Blh family beta-carotene 15,15'-monooxygenase